MGVEIKNKPLQYSMGSASLVQVIVGVKIDAGAQFGYEITECVVLS